MPSRAVRRRETPRLGQEQVVTLRAAWLQCGGAWLCGLDCHRQTCIARCGRSACQACRFGKGEEEHLESQGISTKKTPAAESRKKRLWKDHARWRRTFRSRMLAKAKYARHTAMHASTAVSHQPQFQWSCLRLHGEMCLRMCRCVRNACRISVQQQGLPLSNARWF